MDKRAFFRSLPAVVTFINALIFLPYLPGAGWQSLVAGVLILLSIFHVAAYCSRRVGPGWESFKFTLATDAFFMGGLALVPYFAGWEDAWLLLLPALIPAADVVRFCCCREEARGRRLADSTDRVFLVAEAVLLAMVVGGVLAWHSLTLSPTYPEGLVASAFFFLLGFFLLGNGDLRYAYADEGELSLLLVCIPIAVFVYGLENGETAVHRAFPAIIAVLCAIIIELDRLRCR